MGESENRESLKQDLGRKPPRKLTERANRGEGAKLGDEYERSEFLSAGHVAKSSQYPAQTQRKTRIKSAHSGRMYMKIRTFVAGIKLLVLLLVIYLLVGAYVLILTWSILDYLNAVVELAQLPGIGIWGQ